MASPTQPLIEASDRRTARLAIAPTTLAALAVGAGLGLWRLGERSLWTDEAISLGAVNQLGQTLEGTAGTMALYYVVLDGWTALAGTSAESVRSLSLLIALAALAVVTPVARRCLPRPEAGIAVVAVAALPAFARIAQEARSYALVMTITAACWLCLTRAVDALSDAVAGDDPAGARRARLLLLALAPLGAAGVLAHGLFAAQAVGMAGAALTVPRPLRRAVLSGSVPAAAATGLTVVGLGAVGAGDVAPWVAPLSTAQVVEVLGALVAPHRRVLILLVPVILLGAAVLLRREGGDATDRWAARVPVWWVLAPFGCLVALSTVRPYLVGRYLLASAPAVGLLLVVGGCSVVSGLDRLRGGGRDGRSRTVGTALAVLVGAGLFSALFAGRLAADAVPVEDWDGAAAAVAEGSRRDDGLAFTHSPMAIDFSLRTPFEAAWIGLPATDGPVPLNPDRPLGQVQRFEEPTTDATLAARLARHDRVWVVHKTRPADGDRSLDELLGREPLRSDYREVMRRSFGANVHVLLLVRR